MTRIPVFNVKEVDALAENTCLVISLDAETLFRVQTSETLLQIFSNVFAHLRPNSDLAGLMGS
jgi:anthranilate/para-aminobenzoate synthase component I